MNTPPNFAPERFGSLPGPAAIGRPGLNMPPLGPPNQLQLPPFRPPLSYIAPAFQLHVQPIQQQRPPPPQKAIKKTPLKPLKKTRISRACDRCNSRSVKCSPSKDDPQTCQNCSDFGADCTYDRPKKKRGVPAGQNKRDERSSSTDLSGGKEESEARMLLSLTNGTRGNGNLNMSTSWRAILTDHKVTITDLVEVYFEVVYPIFPLFHKPTMRERVRNEEYLRDQAFYADVMSLCALASARARDGAIFSGRWDPAQFSTPTPEEFFTAANEAMTQEFETMRGLDWMRAYALLALYGIQVGNTRIMDKYLNKYHNLVELDKLDDEKNWPSSLGFVETELRRRLFWSMYTLEVYSCIVWKRRGVRRREMDSSVSFPNEVDDETFSDGGIASSHEMPKDFPFQQIINPESWLHGWNFITSLYCLLEHIEQDYEYGRTRSNVDKFLKRAPPQHDLILQRALEAYHNLPNIFKETKLPENGPADIFSFQAANITATLQLVRMSLKTSQNTTVEEKCTIAGELLTMISQVPLPFLRAISSPLLYHLCGIGSLLGSVMQGPLSESAYKQVREVLFHIAELLENLESGITRTVGAASRLRDQVKRIDEYMQQQRENQPRHHYHQQQQLPAVPTTTQYQSPTQNFAHTHITSSPHHHQTFPSFDQNLHITMSSAPTTSSMTAFTDQSAAYQNPNQYSFPTVMNGMNGQVVSNMNSNPSPEFLIQIPPDMFPNWDFFPTSDAQHMFPGF